MKLEAVLTVVFFSPEISGLTAFSFSLSQGLCTRLLEYLAPIMHTHMTPQLQNIRTPAMLSVLNLAMNV